VLRGSALSITYDAKPPAAPAITGLEGIDGTLLVTYSSPSDADSVTSQVRAEGDTNFTANATDSTVDGSLKLTGLTNRTTYDVQLFAVDSVGNTSAASALGSGTPVPTLGFFEQYKAAGGSEQGCQGATGALLSAVPAWLLWVRRRRRATL
jgi:chitodextrinase